MLVDNYYYNYLWMSLTCRISDNITGASCLTSYQFKENFLYIVLIVYSRISGGGNISDTVNIKITKDGPYIVSKEIPLREMIIVVNKKGEGIK